MFVWVKMNNVTVFFLPCGSQGGGCTHAILKLRDDAMEITLCNLLDTGKTIIQTKHDAYDNNNNNNNSNNINWLWESWFTQIILVLRLACSLQSSLRDLLIWVLSP